MRIKKYYKLIKVDYTDSGCMYIENVSANVGSFSVNKVGTPGTNPNMEYSLDGVNWENYDFTNLPQISVPSGGHLYIKGVNTNFSTTMSQYSSYNNHYSLYFSEDFNIGGSLAYLINKNDPSSVTTISDQGYCYLFVNNTHLIDISKFNFGNITRINKGGLNSAFSGCTNLINCPDMSNIEQIYGDLSSGGCSYLFTGCGSLVTPPNLSSLSIVGENGIAHLLRDCTSLEYGIDFKNNVFSSIGSSSFNSLYYGCSKLSEAVAPNIGTWDTSKFSYWLQNAGTQATGTKTVYAPTGMTINTDSTSGIPTGWTRVDY